MGRPGRPPVRRVGGAAVPGLGVIRDPLASDRGRRVAAEKSLGPSAIILRSELRCGPSGYSDR